MNTFDAPQSSTAVRGRTAEALFRVLGSRATRLRRLGGLGAEEPADLSHDFPPPAALPNKSPPRRLR